MLCAGWLLFVILFVDMGKVFRLVDCLCRAGVGLCWILCRNVDWVVMRYVRRKTARADGPTRGHIIHLQLLLIV